MTRSRVCVTSAPSGHRVWQSLRLFAAAGAICAASAGVPASAAADAQSDGLAATEQRNDQHAAQALKDQNSGTPAEVRNSLAKHYGMSVKPVPAASAKYNGADQAPSPTTGGVITVVSDPTGPITTLSAPVGVNGTERWIFNTDAPYLGLRDQRNGHYVAAGKNGWGFDAAPNHWGSSRGSSNSFMFGYTMGSTTGSDGVRQCAYAPNFPATMREGYTTPDPAHDCTYKSELNMNDYALSWNGNTSTNCNTAGCDGAYTTIDGSKCPWGTPQYSNVQPWINGGERGTNLRSLGPGATVYWRYITKDYRHVLVNVHGLGPGETNWGWIWSDCITNWGPNVQAPDPNI